MHWLSEKEIFTVKFSHLRIMQSNVVRAMIVIPAGICLPSTLNLAGMLMRKAHCECYSRVCIKIDESPLPFLYFYRLHFFFWCIWTVLQEIISRIRCKLGATRSADFFKQMIRIPVWSRFGSLEVWKTIQKATTQCNYRHSYFIPQRQRASS